MKEVLGTLRVLKNRRVSITVRRRLIQYTFEGDRL